MDKIVEIQKKHHEERVKQYGYSVKSLDIKSWEDQYLRFEKLLEVIEKLNNKDEKTKVLDLGAGFGDFYAFLRKKNKKYQYIAVDVVEDMKKISQKIYNDAFPFIVGTIDDIIAKNITSDFVIESGIFNVKKDMSDTEFKKYIFSTIEKMFQVAIKGIGFNMLHFCPDYKRDDLFYINIEELLYFICKNLSRKFILLADYKLFEFTVGVYK